MNRRPGSIRGLVSTQTTNILLGFVLDPIGEGLPPHLGCFGADLHFVRFVRLLERGGRWKRQFRFILDSLRRLFELKIMMDRTVSSLLESMDGVDLVHKPIPISPRILTVVRTGRPFVLGPLNGDISYPPAFASQESWITRGVIALGRRLAPSLHRLLA
ncbi:hypothetical protein AB1L30_00755, partial [Bremerella sp. JC817]|uniref:hypothetical protein n=1 Tax=Bremerella sp. JC817 TaxID=3231756 RepID=UPI0034593D69